MNRQLQKYLHKMQSDEAVADGRVAVLVRDDEILAGGAADLLVIGRAIFERLGVIALVIAEPRLPLQRILPDRLSVDMSCLIPRDTETRTFLHDIPLVRSCNGQIAIDEICRQLGRRKGVLVEGVGMIAAGAVTPEQAYVNFSSVYHSLFVGYMLQLLQEPPQSPAEAVWLQPLVEQLKDPIPLALNEISTAEMTQKNNALLALEQVGRRLVELKLVDSFFGNVSCNLGDELLISQTGASLDALSGVIDLVPHDNSTTAGITASSELAAHRAIYQQTRAAVILHGHPKFSVVLSLLCSETGCPVNDCWKECSRVRYLGSVPVVAGEVGAGGIAETLPSAMSGGIAVVYGHGVFATGQKNFRQPLRAMIELENWCRREYLKRLVIACDSFPIA